MHIRNNQKDQNQSYEHNQIAQIYQKLVKGDNSALNNLQKVQRQKYSNPSVQSPPNFSSKQDNELIGRKKSQVFKNYLRQKVTQLRKQRVNNQIMNQKHNQDIIQYQSIDKINSKKQYQQPKPFSKKRITNTNLNQQHLQQNVIKTGKQEKTQIEAISNKKITNSSENNQYTTNTKDNFKKNLGKNIIKDNQKGLTPPSSKNSFRIKNKPISKKLRQELMRINQQQKRIQNQIITLHNQTKNQVEQTKQKYNLKFKGQGINLGNSPISSNKNINDFDSKQIKVQSDIIKNQTDKITKIYQQIIKINSLLDRSHTKVMEIQNKIQNSPLLPYFNTQEDIFEARESEQEADDVDQLPTNGDKGNNQLGKTYQNLMKEIKKKKWGLNQRFEYDLNKIPNGGQSKELQQVEVKQYIPQSEDIENKGNKVIVNSRLKNLLFD